MSPHTRRRAVATMLYAFAARKAWSAHTIDREIEIFPDEQIGLIRPELHGQFGLIPGLWVGRDSKIPNVHGFHEAAVEYLVALGVPVLQWPGRCAAVNYNWREGLKSGFGTREFMSLCQLVGAQPYLAGGDPKELSDWVQYCNSPLNEERMRNGAEAPFNVKYWASKVRLPGLPFVISCDVDRSKALPDGYSLALDRVTDDAVLHQRRLLDRVDPGRKIGLVLEEGAAGGAVATGLRMNAIHRQADKVVMCNSAMDGLVVVENGKCNRTQAYYAYLLAKPHRGKTAVKTAPPQGNPAELSISASRRDNSVVITAVNPQPAAAVRIRCVVRGHSAQRVSARTLSEYSMGIPQMLEARIRPEGVLAELPALSVSTLVIETEL